MISKQASHAEQLLPNLFDERARTEPQRVFAKTPVSPARYADGFRSVTFLEIATAINRVAWLLDAQFGKGEDFPTITYIGPSDLRYSIMVVAAIKVGYKVRSSRCPQTKILVADVHAHRLFYLLRGTVKQHSYLS